MKSRKVKATERRKAFKKKLKSTIPLEEENSFDEHENDSDDDDDDIQQNVDSSSEEEILPLPEESESDDDEEDDINQHEENSEAEEDYLPSLEDWGKKKSTYYSADFVDKDRGKTYRDEDLEQENAEREAANLLLETGFDLEKFEDYTVSKAQIERSSDKRGLRGEENGEDDYVEAEKIKHKKFKYPKFQEYKEKFLEKLDEVNNKLAPILELAEHLNLDKDFVFFMKLKYQIDLHYLLNLNFYFYLKNSEDIPENHPVYERIEQFKQLDSKMSSNTRYLKEIDQILENLEKSEEVVSKAPKNKVKKLKSKKSKEVSNNNEITKKQKKLFEQIETAEEKEIYSRYSDMKTQQKKVQLNDNETEMDASNLIEDNNNTLDETSEKRTITYQIAKNKGLVPKRKKEYRNPRVHHRMKFKKAKIRRKGQVKGVIKEVKRYAGEPTGISTHVVRSIKF